MFFKISTVIPIVLAVSLSALGCATDPTQDSSHSATDAEVPDGTSPTTCGDEVCADGFECVDAECVETSCLQVDCHQSAQCVDGACVCDQGYSMTGDGCVDVDECVMNNGGCAQLCSNTPGSYECACSDGYALSEDGLNCDQTSPCPGCQLCGVPEVIAGQVEQSRANFETITAGVAEQPISFVLPEDTNGTLELGIHPNVFPIVSSDDGVFVAASQLGSGRVVAFSGQDFLSSSVRSTLLGEAGVRALIANAVDWVSPNSERETVRVLSANGLVGDLLVEAGVQTVRVAEVRFVQGLEAIRNWSAEALADVDVAIIQVNEWGTSHVTEADVEHIRRFVEDGGGLLIAGSALHWSWWLNWTSEINQGDAILDGTGISWRANTVRDVSQGQVRYDPFGSPAALWCGYVEGVELDATQLTRVSPLFLEAKKDRRTRELDLALQRLLADTPALPVQKTDPYAMLSANVGAQLSGYPWPAPHPWSAVFPGAVADNAAPVERTMVIDAQWKRIRPLGLYAAPGQPVTVRLDPQHVGLGLKIQLGERYDDLRYLDHVEEWRRPPLLLSEYEITEDEQLIGNGFGGSLYLVIPEAYPADPISIEISGAIEQALYSRGEDTAADYTADLDRGAPLAILQQEGKVRMVVPTEAARAVADPGAVTDFWAGFYDSHRTLSGEPRPRSYETHWIFDIQVGWGYANATSARLNFPDLAAGWALRTRTGDEDWWLFAHELGHQFQTEDWSGGDITEVAVNLFSMYTINGYLNGGGDRETRGFMDNMIDHAALRDLRWESAGLFEKLAMYRQLVFEFGWTVMGEVFASYYSADYPRERFGGFMDGFAIRFSAISGRDISPFLEHWGYPFSPETRVMIQGLDLQPWLPPGW